MAKVVTGKVRFSYVNVFEPRAAVEGQEAKYSVCIMIPKSDKKTLAAIEKAIEEAKQEGREKRGGKIPAKLNLPLRDGDEARPDQPEFRGHYFLNASSRSKPGLVDKHLSPIIYQQELYCGRYGLAA